MTSSASLDLARDRLVFALDIDDPDAALACARDLAGTLRWIKVGSRLFTTAGAPLVGALRELGYRVFVDLKFHDIPAQVEGSCRAAARLGAQLMTVHAAGGKAMLAAAAAGANAGAADAGLPSPTVLAVTVLTSLDDGDLNDIGVQRTAADQVVALATLVRDAGCGGVVSSPMELPMLRPLLPRPFRILTPGIRPAGSAAGDQKRIMTPGKAIGLGSDYLVVGRPIRNADDRRAAAEAILREMAAAEE